MRSVHLFLMSLVVVTTMTARAETADNQPSTESSVDGLTLAAAVHRTLEGSPALQAAVIGVSAAEARTTQAGLWPNPELVIEIENFGGDGDFRGLDAADTTAFLSQPLPISGRPGRRRDVAESEERINRRRYESLRLDAQAQTTAAFMTVLAAQQREDLARKLLDVAEDFERTVRVRVEAGKVSPVELTRVLIEVSQAKIRASRSQRALAAARTLLAATWGSTTIDFAEATGDLPRPTPILPMDDLRALMDTTPDMQQRAELFARQEHIAALEKSRSLPDLALGIGRRRFEETGEGAWVAAVGFELPIFDRNQGERRAAEFEIEQMQRNNTSFRVTRDAALNVVVERLQAASEAAHSAENEVVPFALAALTAVQTGYREGKFGFVDVIAAQRALFEATTLMLDSLEEYALAHTELERLVGASLTEPIQPWIVAHATDGDSR